ncbi:organic solute transporter Ostalpha-domain-containing protein [Xylariaceae sp. FL1019]|nr:organic solute transporter Ostalpha-domain-containing protein [Xylariaceae sp. FL1019]
MGLFNTTCNSTLEDMRIGSEEKFAGDLTFHQLALIIAGGATIVAIAVSVYLMWQHALNYTKPREQKHIIRILFMVPIYSAASFLALWYYWHAVYFQVISEVYEAFAIASFFGLMCHYIAPDLHEQKIFFRHMTPIQPWIWPIPWFAKCCGGERGIWRTPRSGLTWFNIAWACVYQYCFIRVAFTIIAVVTQYFGKYCESSNSPVFAHIWVTAFEAVAVTIAMYCIIQFYVQFKKPLADQHLGMKVLAIKLVIFLSFWQTIAIDLATSESLNLVSATSRLAWPDLKVGIPSLLLCIEMALFAILHLWSFSYVPYKEGAKPTFYPNPNMTNESPSRVNESGPKQGGFLGIKALFDAGNPWDIAKAFGRGIRWLFVGAKRRHEDPSYQLGGDTSYVGKDGMPLKSTDHLPIATQFRRSTYGMPISQNDPIPEEESAGLIANAQSNPGSRQNRPSSLESDPNASGGHSLDLRPQYHENSYANDQSYSAYRPYNDESGDIGAPPSSYQAYDPNASYGAAPPGSPSRQGTGNPRNSTQARIGNALWGDRGNQYQPHQGSGPQY